MAGTEAGEAHAARVRALGHRGVVRMWEQLRALKSGERLPGWPPGIALEYLLLRAFQLEGAEVEWPFQVDRDKYLLEQIDGVVYIAERVSCLIEAKQHASPLNALPIIKMKAQLMRRPRATIGAVFSTSDFTPEAIALSQLLPPADVLLWRGREIDWALRRRSLCEGMRLKLRHATERGFPDLDITLTGRREA